jgi:hypothetical protein
LHVTAAACLVSLFAAAAFAPGDAPRLERDAGRTTVFRDGLGENRAGPDITTVRVSSDGGGLVTFRVGVPTNPVLTEDMRLRIWLDADDDRTTGLAVEGLEGLDHFLLVDAWQLGFGAAGLYGCTGSTCSGGRRGPDSTLRFTYENGATFTIDAAELGLRRLERLGFSVVVTAGIRFDPVERKYDLTNATVDTAPDEGRLWTYDARLLRVTSFSATPAVPQAGKPFVLRMTAVRTDTGAALARGTVSCSTRIRGRPTRVRTRRFVGTHAVCGFDIPKHTRGQRFRSTIGVVRGGAQVTRSLSGRIG